MGHSSIQMTMRYAHLAPQHNRAAVDRLVLVGKPHRVSKKSVTSVKRENELVTKSVTSRKRLSRVSAENQNNTSVNNKLQQVAP
jgi:outer membrane receptor for Fe3+-dicitrate